MLCLMENLCVERHDLRRRFESYSVHGIAVPITYIFHDQPLNQPSLPHFCLSFATMNIAKGRFCGTQPRQSTGANLSLSTLVYTQTAVIAVKSKTSTLNFWVYCCLCTKTVKPLNINGPFRLYCPVILIDPASPVYIIRISPLEELSLIVLERVQLICPNPRSEARLMAGDQRSSSSLHPPRVPLPRGVVRSRSPKRLGRHGKEDRRGDG